MPTEVEPLGGEQRSVRSALFWVASAVFVPTVVALPVLISSAPLRAVGAVLAAGLVANLGARRVLRNAHTISAVAQRMAKGDFSIRTRNMGDVWLQGIGRSLDDLAQSLNKTLGELKVERDLLGGILAGMQEGVMLLERGGRIALVNPALRDMLLLGADAVGKLPIEVLRNGELKTLLDRAAASSTPALGEVELSGIKPRRLLVRAISLLDEPGGTLAVFVDVTDVRRLESMRRDFVANVSHELRTPVTAIRSAAETVRGAASHDPAAAMRFIDIIERNADRLLHLVEDLLELSRIESREFRLTFEPVDPHVFLPFVLSLFRERAERKRIRLYARLDQDLPPISADRRALEQVITNLVDNAVKYCPEAAEVVVRAHRVGDHAEISVSDTGPGIDGPHLSRIFERFYRIDPGRSRDVGGTGLGLSIVKHLVEALGGIIRVESQLGRGTTFRFSLPFASDRPSGPVSSVDAPSLEEHDAMGEGEGSSST